MCRVYEFPKKKELSDAIKDDIRQMATDYFNVLLEALEYLEVNTDDLQAITEVGNEITAIYEEHLRKIVEAVEEES